MEDWRSKQMELASDLAHIATREMKGISDDEMWIEEEEAGEMVYPEHIQDLFNEFYDSFDTHVTHIFTEPKVYVLDTDQIDDNDSLLPESDKFDEAKFIERSELEGTIYSLSCFQNKLNNQEINTATDFIYIKY